MKRLFAFFDPLQCISFVSVHHQIQDIANLHL